MQRRDEEKSELKAPTSSIGQAIDPVCGMTVDIAAAKHVHRHGGTEYFFCSGGCKAKFQGNPAKYLFKDQAAPEKVDVSATYTCPMHPEIRPG
jgi:P-type Cu+ transporter